MTGTNHGLTGAVIAAVISEPAIALPLAFASHFALDSLPHFGLPGEQSKAHPGLFRRMMHIDIFMQIMLFVLWALFVRKIVILAGALLAMSPDIAWVYRFVVSERWGRLPAKPKNLFNRLHSVIQWGEFAAGWRIEAVWFIGMGSLLIYVI